MFVDREFACSLLQLPSPRPKLPAHGEAKHTHKTPGNALGRFHEVRLEYIVTFSRSPKPLTILHIATINKAIAKGNGYSPIETVILNVDAGLTALGHRSIVACTADSIVSGEHFETLPKSLGDYCRETTAAGDVKVLEHLEMAFERARAGDIDVIHMHQWFEHLSSGRFTPPVPVVMTLHVPGHHSGYAELRDKDPERFARALPMMSPVAISEYQRQQYASLVPVAATVHHGIDVASFLPVRETTDDAYLLTIGRITGDKGQDTSIEVARRSGKQLIIAGCVQDKPEDRAFFERIKPSIDRCLDLSEEPVTADYYERVMQPILALGKQTIYVGELSGEATRLWYRHAAATLFPIRWGEPFGMVLIESMAAGTPVIAFGEGAVPEIVVHGITGFVVDSVDGMVAAVGNLPELDRGASRRHVQANFSVERMTARYVDLYEQVARPETPRLSDSAPFPPTRTRERVPLI